jgi:hypothetical protein
MRETRKKEMMKLTNKNNFTKKELIGSSPCFGTKKCVIPTNRCGVSCECVLKYFKDLKK